MQFLEPGWIVSDPGELQRIGNRFFVEAKAERSADGSDAELWEMAYDIPQPEPGIYTFTFCLNGQVCDSTRFEVARPDRSIRVRSVEVAFTGDIACPEGEPGDELFGGCFYQHTALVTVTTLPHIAVVNWGQPMRRDGNVLVIDIETAEVPVPGAEPDPNDPDSAGLLTDSHRYDLGLLSEGEWTLRITSAGQRLSEKHFNSPASSGVKAQLRTGALDPQAMRHEFHVVYSGPSEINVATLGDDDIQVVNPIVHSIDFAGPIPECLTQFAKLVSYQVAEDRSLVDATYAITCTEGWDHFTGGDFPDWLKGLDVFLVDGGVKTQTGLSVEGQDLGIIPFKRNTFRLDAHADARPVHEPGEIAEIFVSYLSPTPIDLSTVGDGDIAILKGQRIGPNGDVIDLENPLFATLRESNAMNGGRLIEAVYELAPAGGWNSDWNGEYPLTLVRGELANEDGQLNQARDIGVVQIDIEPDLVIGEATIAVRQEGDKILADVVAQLTSHTITDWGQSVRRGNTFYLDANGQLSDAAAAVVQEHTYQLLPQVNLEEPLDFEVIPDEAFFPAFFTAPLDIVVRSVEEWEALIGEYWHPAIDAEMPEPPVDFGSHMLVGVAVGQKARGIRCDDLPGSHLTCRPRRRPLLRNDFRASTAG